MSVSLTKMRPPQTGLAADLVIRLVLPAPLGPMMTWRSPASTAG
jgi:hypothetical protein